MIVFDWWPIINSTLFFIYLISCILKSCEYSKLGFIHLKQNMILKINYHSDCIFVLSRTILHPSDFDFVAFLSHLDDTPTTDFFLPSILSQSLHNKTYLVDRLMAVPPQNYTWYLKREIKLNQIIFRNH